MESITKSNLFKELKEKMRSLNIDVKPVQIIQGLPEAYKNDSGPPRGSIFVANFREFSNDVTRYGSEIDVENLTNLFSQMGYIKKGIQNCTKTETMEAMQSFSKDNIHEKVDSMVLVVMSHGLFDNTFFTSDGQPITRREIYEIFNDKNCPALKGKPKMFIFKLCRGKNNFSVCPDFKSNRRGKDKSLSDIIVLHSAHSGEVSFLHKKYGSPYIYQLCRVFMENAWQSEMSTLMKEVNIGMLKYNQGCEYEEIRKKRNFYFNPKPIEFHDVQEKVQNDCKNYQEIVGNDGKLEIQFPKENGFAACSSILALNPSAKQHVLLINNLNGCEPDMDKLNDLFTSLGYNVIDPVLNVTYKKLKDVIKEFKEIDHGESTYIIFYGDGFDDYIVTSDHYAIHINELQKEFNDINCPHLSNKPKIFITNICYFDGDINYESTHQHESPMGHEEEIDSELQDWALDGNYDKFKECILQKPAESDMFFLNVEMEGSHCENGSLLTDALYQVLMENDSPKELMQIMRSVSERLDVLQEGGKEDYICELREINFPSNFYIRPIKPQKNLTVSPKINIIERWPLHPWKTVKVKESKKEQKYEENCYKNKSEPRGLALIISFGVYAKGTLPNCTWREGDASMFKKLFNKLGYSVIICNDTSLQDTISHLVEFSKLNDHSNYDSSLILIMGHGADRNTFYTKEGNKLSLQDVYGTFTDSNCPALKGKPKIFIQHMTKLDDFNSHQTEDSMEKYPDLRDAFSIQLTSTVMGTTVSTQGLWELRILLEEQAHNTHILSILSRLEEKIDTSKENCNRQYFTFIKNFFFNPKEYIDY